MRIESRLHFLETEEALDQQSRADQQHERERHFADEQEVARVCPPMPFTAAPAFFKRAADVEFRGLQRGREPEENAGENRKTEREKRDAIIEPDLIEARPAFRQERQEHVHQPDAQE